MKKFANIVYKLDDWAGMVSNFFIFANMLVVTCSVLMRILFKNPISGLTDIVGFLCAINAVFAFGYTEKERGFIQVDFVKEYFPKIIQRFLHVIIGLMDLTCLVLVTWQFFLYGISTYQNGNVTWVMFLPYYPVVFACCLGMLLYVLTELVHFIEVILGWKEGRK